MMSSLMNIFLRELRYSLRRAHDTAAGPDEIHYQILKHLPYSSLLILLHLFNQIWVDGHFLHLGMKP